MAIKALYSSKIKNTHRSQQIYLELEREREREKNHDAHTGQGTFCDNRTIPVIKHRLTEEVKDEEEDNDQKCVCKYFACLDKHEYIWTYKAFPVPETGS